MLGRPQRHPPALIMNWVDKNGDATTMKWVEIGSAIIPALIEHRIDFSMLDEPLLSAALATGKLHQIGNSTT